VAPRFDLFRMQDGDPIWVSAIEQREDAQWRIKELMSESQGEFVLLDRVTGQKIVVTPESSICLRPQQ
jgi:hypothetical protein